MRKNYQCMYITSKINIFCYNMWYVCSSKDYFNSVLQMLVIFKKEKLDSEMSFSHTHISQERSYCFHLFPWASWLLLVRLTDWSESCKSFWQVQEGGIEVLPGTSEFGGWLSASSFGCHLGCFWIICLSVYSSDFTKENVGCTEALPAVRQVKIK